MTDWASPYTLTTPVGTIQFNDSGIDDFNRAGGPDEYYISNIRMPRTIRAPVDNAPGTDGFLVHPFLRGGRRIPVEGWFAIRSTRIQNNVRKIRNQMFKDLDEALDSIMDADGTLSWVIEDLDGTDARSFTVRCEIGLEDDGIEMRTFTFGLIAASAQWTT